MNNIKISDEYYERHQEIYLKMKSDLKSFLAETLTNDEKEDLNAAHMTIMSVLRIAANMSISLDIEPRAFIYASRQMYKAEEIVHKKNKENKANLN